MGFRNNLICFFDDDSVEKQNIKVGFLVDKTGVAVNHSVCLMLSEQGINKIEQCFVNKSDYQFLPIPKLSGNVKTILKSLNYQNNKIVDFYDNIEKAIDEVLNKHFRPLN